jgi:hypothetical protein
MGVYTMSEFEILQLFFFSGQKIDTLWQFFVTVHLAVIGGIFAFKHLDLYQRIMIIASYTIFSLMNLRAKYHEYRIYCSIIDDIKNNFQNQTEVNAYIYMYTASDRISITITVHLISIFFVIISNTSCKGKLI